jgi:hypothetical protein
MGAVKLGPVFAYIIATDPEAFVASTIDHAKPHAVEPPAEAPSVQLGEHIVQVCRGCHGQQLSGGKLAGDPDMPIVANITPHETGLKSWNEADFIRALREGKRKDGTAIDVPPLSLEVETIEVNAKTDEVPVRGNTTTGETFQAAKLEYIPTARSYTEVLKIAPGVSEDNSGGNSTAPAGISVYGSSAQESSYIIDGVNTTSIDTGRPSTNINYDLIDKIEVKTGGYNAEFGGAQGAVVNVTTNVVDIGFHALIVDASSEFMSRPHPVK